MPACPLVLFDPSPSCSHLNHQEILIHSSNVISLPRPGSIPPGGAWRHPSPCLAAQWSRSLPSYGLSLHVSIVRLPAVAAHACFKRLSFCMKHCFSILYNTWLFLNETFCHSFIHTPRSASSHKNWRIGLIFRAWAMSPFPPFK